jgi:CRP-like cAMP-binding protein
MPEGHEGRGGAVEEQLFQRFGRTAAAGEVLFTEGDPGRDMFVIQSGKVQLTRRARGGDQHLATLPAGEFFGEMAVVNNQPRSATATVIEDARLLVIDSRTFEAMVRGNAEIALRLIKKLAGRLSQANAQVEMLLAKDANLRVVHGLRELADSRGAPDGLGVRLDVTVEELAREVGLDVGEAESALGRLERARLVMRHAGGAITVAGVGKLGDFIEFLEIAERFGS